MPLENRLEELYTVVGFIDDRRLGPAYRFFHRHRGVDEKGKVQGYHQLDVLREKLKPIFGKLNAEFVRLDGKVPQEKREERVHEFQNNPKCRAIIMSNAGSTGLNLQSANTVINVDLPWNPAILEQRVVRAHRMGQKQPVHVYMLVTEECIEERLLSTLSAKHDLALTALDVNSEVSSIELQSGMEELKRRLERLLGEKPTTPVDESLLRDVEVETAMLAKKRDVERREKVAAAGGELLGAALNLVGQLLDTGSQPNSETVSVIHQRLTDCVEKDETGRPQLRFTLPNDEAVKGLAETLAKLLAVSSSS